MNLISRSEEFPFLTESVNCNNRDLPKNGPGIEFLPYERFYSWHIFHP